MGNPIGVEVAELELKGSIFGIAGRYLTAVESRAKRRRDIPSYEGADEG